jgi:hypothetical protein
VPQPTPGSATLKLLKTGERILSRHVSGRLVAGASSKTFIFFVLPFAESTSSLSHRDGIAGLVIDDICLIPRRLSRPK